MSAGPAAPWRFRACEPGDEPSIVRLFERCSHRHVDAAYWRWKLRRRPSPVENVWLAVDADGRAIFHYAGIPCLLRLPAGERPAMVAVDALTDPGFRRRGLLTAGVAAAHAAWRRAGVALVLGLPNEQWGSRLAALDWRPLFELRWRLRPLRPEALLARRLGLPIPAVLGDLWNGIWSRRRDPALAVDDVEPGEEELDALGEAGWASIVRRGGWLAWRYLSHPRYDYRVIAARRNGRLAGYLAYRWEEIEGRTVGFVAELAGRSSDPAARGALLGAASARLRDRGAEAVHALAVPGSELDRDLRRAGFVFARGSFAVWCVPLADDLDLAALRDPRRWRLQGGDFDVI